MKKIIATIAMLFSVMLLTTGCMKFDMSLQVSDKDTVSGSVVFAISDSVMQALGSAGGDTSSLDTSKILKDAKFDAKASVYKDGKYTGTQVDFADVPLDEFDTGDNSDTLSIVRDGDNIVVSGALDMSGGADPASIEEAMSNPLTAAYFKDVAITVSVTLPGEIKSTNGEQAGNKITWTGEYGKKIQIDAVAYAPKGNPAVVVVGALVAVVIIAGVVLLVLRNKKKSTAAASAAEPENSEAETEKPAE